MTAEELPQLFKDALKIAIYKKKGEEEVTMETIVAFRYSQLRGKLWKNASEKSKNHCRSDHTRKPTWISSLTLYNRNDIHLASVDWSTLWILLRKYRCPDTFVQIIQ